MNERMQKLAEESGIMHTSMSDAEWIKQGRLVEKFAELIVQECARQVTRNEALNIFEHFGVDH